MTKKYIHYGSDSFNPLYFLPIKNRPIFNKPSGGLWATPCDSECSWYNWCVEENFRTDRLNQHFIFTLNNDAKILTIKSHADLTKLKEDGLCLNYDIKYLSLREWFYPDFEKILESGYSAIEVYIQDSIYMDLYGWDCDSLLVLDPNCIVTV